MEQQNYRVGVVGTGYVGSGLLRVLTRHPRLSASGVLTRRDPKSLGHLAVDPSRITHDPEKLYAESDIIVECTGDVLFGTEVIEGAFRAGLPVVTMNAELQVVSGSALANRGVLTEAEGDQPGSLAALDHDARSMGFEPVVYGNAKGFLNLSPTQKEMEYWAEKFTNRLDQIVANTDGTKVQIEQALVANAFNADIARRGLSGGSFTDIPHAAEKLAAVAEHVGTPIADYAVCEGGKGGVFIVARHDMGEQAALSYMKLGEGPYYLLVRPFHLCHLEIPKTILAILDGNKGVPRFNNGPRPGTTVVAVAKRDLVSGGTIEKGVGSFEVRGEAERIVDARDAVPICLLQDVTIVRDVRAGATLSFADVELPKSRAHALWQEVVASKRKAQISPRS